MIKNKISILIPCYNGGQFLKNSIKSVLNQTYKNFILFLIDNGSTDNSYEVMKYYKNKDKRIKIIKFSKKTSRGKSLNKVIKKCNTKLIAVLDADDIYFKKKIYKQLVYLNKHPEVEALGTLANYINVDNNLSAGVSSSNLTNHNSCFKFINKNKTINIFTPTAIFSKKIFLKVGGFRDEYWPADDTDLWTRIAEKGHIVYTLPEILISYRIHANSITTSNFMDSRLKAMWVKENLILRNINHKEISFSKFKKKYLNKNIYIKIKEYTDSVSDLYFRNSIVYLINKNYILFIVNLFISSLFAPIRFLKKTLVRIKNLL